MRLNLKNFESCIASIGTKAAVGEQAAIDMLESVADRAEQLRAEGDSNPFGTAAKELFTRQATQAREAKLRAMRNARIQFDQYKWLDNDATLLGADRGRNFAQRFRSLFYWQPGSDVSRNMSAKRWTKGNDLSSTTIGALEAKGLWQYARSPKSHGEIARAIWEFAKGGNPTGPAGEVARLLFNPLDSLGKDLNRAGAHIEDPLNYFLNSDHERILMRQGGRSQGRTNDPDVAFQRWFQMLLRVSDNRTWAKVKPRNGETPLQAKERYAKQLFRARISGTYRIDSSGHAQYTDADAAVAKALDEGRAIYFRDADSWTAYNAEYGSHRNMASAVNAAIMQASRDLALMETFGSNYNAGMTKIINQFMKNVQGIDQQAEITASEELRGGWRGKKGGFYQPNIYNVMAEFDGSANLPQYGIFFQLERTIIPLWAAMKLGNPFNDFGSMFSTFPRTATTTIGTTTLDGIGQALKSLLPYRRGSPEWRQVFGEVSAYAEGLSRQTYDDWMQGLGVVGVASSLARNVMRFSGINYVSDHVRNGMRFMLAEKLGRWSGQSFDQLHPQLRQTLTHYGVSPAEWDLLRATPMSRIGAGKYLSPANASRIPDGALTNMAAARAMSVEDFKLDLGQRIGMLFHDMALQSNVTPGIRERAIMRQGMRPGTPQSVLLSSMLMFKSWPIAALHQNLGRELYQNTGNKFGGVVTLLGLSAFGGFLSLALKGLVTGQGVPTARDPGDWMRIALQSTAVGGGLGLLGDVTFGEFAKANGISTSSIISAGPPAQDAMKLLGISTNWLMSLGSDQPYDPWPDLLRLGRGTLPGGNVAWVRGSMDYLMWYQLYEMASPGWWERANQAQIKRQGYPRMGYVPGRGVPLSPFAGLLGK